jgi:hypothetical protein
LISVVGLREMGVRGLVWEGRARKKGRVGLSTQWLLA